MAESDAALVRVAGVSKRFGTVQALDEVSLSIRHNEFFALLGPSGCGKTTLLRALAGFETPDRGQILLDGRDLVGVPPYRRPFNMMFQSYALFPHMSVFDNVAYGVRQERVRAAELERRVGEALAMVEMEPMARRRPQQLSGGQRQRVALARALVKRPRLLLLDEPLAALDRKLRTQMQFELKRLQSAVGISFVLVTHDQEEALVMADRAAIMDHGKVLQLGPPTDLYERPTSRFVAAFVGESNLVPGTLRRSGSDAWLESGDRRYPVAPDVAERSGLADGDGGALVVRPERVRLRRAGAVRGEAPDSGTVAEVDYLGATRRYVVRLAGGGELVARVQAGQPADDLAAGERVEAAWDPGHAALVRDESPDGRPTAISSESEA